MIIFKFNVVFLLTMPLLLACNSCNTVKIDIPKNTVKITSAKYIQTKILTGADQTKNYLSTLKGKKVGLVINQTAEIDGVNLVDTLKSLGIEIKAIFGPEHGFRGNADAGEKVGNYTDKQTSIPVISLYGAKSAPSKEDLKNIDLMVFDIQDVGARFYTYTITMAKIMQACADSDIPLMILDRPNPNGDLIDGPILNPNFKSGVGIHPIPISHGLTVAEFAQMINGEGWLNGSKQCKLIIIKNENYKHSDEYILPVKPSPNLPNNLSIYLYPSLCMFEGTVLSQGRGTLFPFQVLGHPLLKGKYDFTFTPKSINGMSKNPPLENQLCYGIDFRKMDLEKIRNEKKLDIKLLIDIYKYFPDKERFFNSFFNKLAGNDVLMQQIITGNTEKEIRDSWQPALNDYKVKRNKYLLYN